MYTYGWIFALVLCGCSTVPVSVTPTPLAPTVSALASAFATPPQAGATPLPQANVAVSTSNGYQFTDMRDSIAYTYTVRFRPHGDYDGIMYPNDHLLISYSFVNSGTDAILFNRVVSDFSVLGEVSVAPQPDSAVAIGQRAFAEPTDRVCPDRDATIVPVGSWLRANDVATGQIYVELPLQQLTPFDNCTPVPPMLPSSAPMRVCFGYTRPTSRVTIDENGSINVPFSNLQALVTAQQLLCGADFTLEILQ